MNPMYTAHSGLGYPVILLINVVSSTIKKNTENSPGPWATSVVFDAFLVVDFLFLFSKIFLSPLRIVYKLVPTNRASVWAAPVYWQW